MICLLICLTTDAKLKVSHHREATAPEASAHILQMPAPSCEFKSTTLTNAGVFPMPDGCLVSCITQQCYFDTLEAAAHQSGANRDLVMPKASLSHQPADARLAMVQQHQQRQPTDTLKFWLGQTNGHRH
jgi:hypothetical protein